MSIALDNIRTNKSYILTNYGEEYEFSVVEIQNDQEFLLRDLNTLEYYYMSELIGNGRSKDFSIWEK